MNYVQKQKLRQVKRARRVRSKMSGTSAQPRISVYRSNKHIQIQVIDDEQGKTLTAVSDLGKSKSIAGTKTERTVVVAKDLAKAMKRAKITKAAFDRGANKYHGRVKAVAETLREEGIEV